MNAPPVPDPARCALFLDFDGVLVDIAPRPDAVQVAPGILALLRRLAACLHGRLAVVSGRPLAEIDHFLQRAAPHAVGLHGAERRGPDGVLSRALPAPGLEKARHILQQAASDHPALLLEDKGLALALHWRTAPELGASALQAATRAQAAAGNDMALQPGKMVIELKPARINKGSALTDLMARAPFAGTTPIMLGDDLTDETAFRAAAGLGGAGVLVGPLRETAAEYCLPDVAAVHDWLSALTNS
ncbi:MAG: trehalose-phosphatase [Pararhodobacter sp.]|nr:trehalose-phosphatase [Pararhodobacter sp.]